jgi:transketolase C-terminal domain/subunit
MITETITQSQFSDAFYKMGRGKQFSYEAKNLIYDYLDELENYELDVIGICCEFAEYDNLKEFQNDYGEEYISMEMIEDATTVLWNGLEGNPFVIVQF